MGGPRGGDKYWELLLERLSGQAEVVAVNRKVLGLSGIVSGRQYADALARHLATTAWRAPVLHDGSSFYQMTETNHMLKKAGWGPIVSLMQEWLPAREHSFRARLHLNRYLFRYLHSVDAHVVVSGWLKQRMQRLGVKGSRIDVAHPGVATACFENAATPVRHPSSVLRIVSAGVYHRSKGQLLLVEALGELAKKAPDRIGAYRVDMYGAVTSEEQPYFDVVQRRIAELGLQSIVSAHGPLPQQQLWNVFGQADVFAFMAEGEGLALVVMEAMLHGCVPLVPRGSPMDDQLLPTESLVKQ